MAKSKVPCFMAHDGVVVYGDNNES